MEPDPRAEACAQLAKQFRGHDGTDRWRVWPGEGNGLFYAWRIQSSPPVVLRDKNLRGLRARMETFGRVHAETRSAAKALAAAERLDT